MSPSSPLPPPRSAKATKKYLFVTLANLHQSTEKQTPKNIHIQATQFQKKTRCGAALSLGKTVPEAPTAGCS